MMEYIEALPWIFGAIFIVVIFTLFSISGIFLIRRILPFHNLKAHHDVAGFVFTNLGVLYAVLLGFTVVNVQQRFDKLNQIVEVEAGYLAELYRDAEVFPQSNRQEIRNAIRSYGQSVIEDEWPSITSGVENPKTIEAQKKIWDAYYKITPSTNREIAWYTESISRLNLLMTVRLSRVLGVEGSLGAEMWIMLVLGGAVMVAFLWFFGLDSIKTHMLMSAILAASIAFLLFLIYSLDTAFSGSISIQPEAFSRVLQLFQESKSVY